MQGKAELNKFRPTRPTQILLLHLGLEQESSLIVSMSQILQGLGIRNQNIINSIKNINRRSFIVCLARKL